MQCGYSSHILISTYRVSEASLRSRHDSYDVPHPTISSIPPHIFSTKSEHIIVQAPHLSVESCMRSSLYNRGCASLDRPVVF